MLHSIIIPHRAREAHLKLCLRSIALSAQATHETDYEVVVVDDAPPHVQVSEPNTRVVGLPLRHPFNKPRALNVGIETSSGRYITFLDADAIVGPMFLRAWQRLERTPALTKLCYRVVKIDEQEVVALGDATDPAPLFALFEGYADRKWAKEAHGLPHSFSSKSKREPLFGHSQFCISRERLGDLRFHEKYAGRGWEDIQFNFALWKHYGPDYLAAIETSGLYSMFHIDHPIKNNYDWGSNTWNRVNRNRYMRELGQFRRERKIQQRTEQS